MGRYGNVDYPTLTKRSVVLGLGLFLVGVLGQMVIQTASLSAPGWEHTLLFDAEVLGVVVTLLSPFVFGILLPLTE
ncbi:MAG: hypothetical protein ABEJ06_04545 [Haloarculaceae archaeon]